MFRIPRASGIDGTLAFLREGYGYAGKRFQDLDSDVFRTRILGRPAIFLLGEDAARLFYDENLFARGRAVPRRVQKTLMGRGGIQTLDGEAHSRRKAMFLSLFEPPEIERLARIHYAQWMLALADWPARERVVLLPAAGEILCRTICEWAGVPLEPGEEVRRARDFEAMIDAPAAVGPRHLKGRAARARAEAWMGSLVSRVRSHRLVPTGGSALEVVSGYHNPDGSLLSVREAAVELLNVLRPAVAVAVFDVFAALALHGHPGWRERLRAGFSDWADPFVQEVRRFYPFFPIVGARVRRGFLWRGYRFPAGMQVFLDLYGTDHDPRIWERPGEFDPARFRDTAVSDFALVPQGGGDARHGHRCPGEAVTRALMKTALDFLANGMEYETPPQDLSYALSRMPARPAGGFVMARVVPAPDRLRGALGAVRLLEPGAPAGILPG